MTDSYDLSHLNPEVFENIVNFLVLKTLGLGSTGFGPGADGGRDGYFQGEAPYPSETEHWKGIWYVQSKFHKPHLSKDPQKWLIDQVKGEIEAFDKKDSDRNWPDNWIIATNIEPSGKPETGSFDAIRKLLNKSPKGKKVHLAIWGGRKILNLLASHNDVARYYGHFLTPGHVLSALYAELAESRASLQEIIRYFVVTQFNDNKFTKLDQAGSSADMRPGVHDLFIDLPFSVNTQQYSGEILAELCSAAAQCHRYSLRNQFPDAWRSWHKHSKRARVCLIKGGPGQGKSTVSQYLCQIHRANLILASNDLLVSDSVKEAAQEINDAAQDHNFLPTTPRIPIQIELKEFAHWYSQRGSADSKNVLTYLSEMVAKKIGSEVLVKTLKNALAKRSWIVVFDGLDEVPNDSKDAVANEVMYFLNDVLVEIDADVLALCTSRPQGYSGQFAGIDGPVLELSLLDADTALRCAIPVLKFGRTSEEYETSVAILTAAIESPSIKELMTTPLQSHIMAVVVRDGGRPPERRWQLFNGFYLVMKKRESQKGFKNPRIAKLLNEEDKLLKSVHTRLGFVLHARAERSEGAQTALNKTEFHSLVHHVVTELHDHEIEQTVADLMEAVTERLVLVNTPECGEQVRFDIRQLQEFFAAEFLYEDVEATEIGNRIEVIGGDAHWREVMHFLLSALIENRRTSDIAVAVQVLGQLNDGDETSDDKLYRRRMAKACLLANRLLTEGVLEQDKGDRQKIKPLLEPLGGLLDLNVLRSLAHITPTRSRQWLIDFLLNKVETASPREYVGALFLLGWLLPTGHNKTTLVYQAFFKAPLGWQERLYKLWEPDASRYFDGYKQDSDWTLSHWVIDVAIDTLNSPNWLAYCQETIVRLLNLCGDQGQRFLASCKMKGFEDQVAGAIFKCLEIDRITNENQNSEIIDCGLLEGTPYTENWINGKMPKTLTGIDAKKGIDATGGVFKLLFSCVWFAQERSASALNMFIAMADHADSEKLAVLPGALLALVPIEKWHSTQPYSVAHLRDIDASIDHWLDTLTTKRKIQPPFKELRFKGGGESTPKQWRLLVEQLPRLALSMAIYTKISMRNLQPQFIPELVSLFETMPYEASRYFLGWGSLQKNQPELFNSLKAAVCVLPPRKIQIGFSFYDLTPFKLKLPEEIQLLSLLAPALVSWFEHGYGRDSIVQGRTNVSEVQPLQSIFSEYNLSAVQLRDIAELEGYEQTVRASALALYWLMQLEIKTNLNLNRERTLYAELVDDSNESWLAGALISGVLMRCAETDTDALAFVTYLMERCHEGGELCDKLITLLANWRERSLAPIHSRQVMNIWLGCDIQIPTYAHSA